MKKILSVIAFLALAAGVLSAQDSRQRKPETIVQDVLALVPSTDASAVQAEIQSLVGAAPEALDILFGKMQPYEAQANEKTEYVIHALTQYASDPAHAEAVEPVKAAFQKAIAACTDQYNKAFLEQELRLVAYADAAPVVQPATAPDPVRPRLSAAEFASLDLDDQRDAIYWIGENRDKSQLKLVLSNLKEAADENLCGDAAIAASKIGGKKAAKALVAALLGGKAPAMVTEALERFNGNIAPAVLKAMKKADGQNEAKLIELAGIRHIKGAFAKVVEALASPDEAIAEAARGALKGVVTEKNLAKVASLLDGASDGIADYKAAFQNVLNFLPEEDRTAVISEQIAKAANPQNFFSALAATGSDEAVEALKANLGGNHDAEALEALAATDNFDAAEPLFAAASAGQKNLLPRYLELVEDYRNDFDKITDYVKALDVAGNDNSLIVKVLEKMGRMKDSKAFQKVAEYIDRPEIAKEVADILVGQAPNVAGIVEYDTFKNIISKVNAVNAKASAKGDADAGYAIDAMKKLVDESKPFVNALTPEEAAQGFKLLFNGKDLSGWVGDLEGYAPVNGAITVNSNYGGNLYTEKEYRNFIYRFEFRFLEEGVNNGVGIRTPFDVDAAYDAMCECQILDHDAPMYADLHEYQVHGSVYGVVPAKRLVHRPLGQWSQEEIVVNGDNIKVTVNGEVLVDANVREACQGHNVAPEGKDENPYTVDHRNHPGMFNERGHVSFCGHGHGLQFKNVRILELED